MSHHLDSPEARRDPRLNITDQYVFDDRDATVFVLNTRTSLAGDTAAPGFHDEARYEFRIHLDHSPAENLTFRLVFDPADGGEGGQAYRLYRLEAEAAGGDAAAGVEIARGRTGQTVTGADRVQVWAGRALDPFYLDLGQLDAVDKVFIHGEDAEINDFPAGKASNTFAGSAVQSIVLRIPLTDTHLFPDRLIRVWATTRLATDAGGWRQVSRAGIPMIWPLFRDADTDAASRADAAHPSHDHAAYGVVLRKQVEAAVRRLGTSARPEAYALGVVDRILPDTLPYQVGTPAIFGFTDFNGRNLADNAPEVMFSLATNSAVSTGLTPESIGDTFPFVIEA